MIALDNMDFGQKWNQISEDVMAQRVLFENEYSFAQKCIRTMVQKSF